MFKKTKGLNLLMAIIIFSLSIFPRIYKISSTEIYPDEITWLARSRESFLAIKTGRFEYFKNAWWKKETDTEAINLPLTIFSGASMFFLAKNQPTHYSLNLFPDYIAARLSNAFIYSLFVVFFYFSIVKITKNKKIALLTTLLFSLDPIFLGLSRWILADNYLMIFTFLSMFFAIFSQENVLSILISSFFLCLAFLTKPTGLVLLPIYLINSPKKFLKILVFFLIFTSLFWLGSSKFVCVEIWQYLTNQFHLAQAPFTTFFNNQITANPPMYYYIQEIITRLPLLTLFGLVIIPINKGFKSYKINKNLKFPILFILFYLLTISIPSKKLGVRYAFPVYPWIYLFSGISIFTLIDSLKTKLKNAYFIPIVLIPIFTAVYFFPNYYLFYNQILGGPKNAQKSQMVGLCMGAKETVEYVNNNVATNSIAYMGCNKTVIPYYSSLKTTTDWKDEKYVVIEESFKTLSPEEDVAKFFKDKNPLYVNTWKGVVLSKLYVNENI